MASQLGFLKRSTPANMSVVHKYSLDTLNSHKTGLCQERLSSRTEIWNNRR